MKVPIIILVDVTIIFWTCRPGLRNLPIGPGRTGPFARVHLRTSGDGGEGALLGGLAEGKIVRR